VVRLYSGAVGIVSIAQKLLTVGQGTPWDISNASYLRNISASDSAPSGLYFRSDGLKLYVAAAFSGTIREYDLGTAWNVSTAVYFAGFSYSASLPAGTNVNGVFFKSDGTKMYLPGSPSGDGLSGIYEFSLSAWSVSTASYSQFLGTSGLPVAVIPRDVFFNSDGDKMYLVSNTTGLPSRVAQYSLTSWDISTAVYVRALDLTARGSLHSGVFFKPDGSKLYTLNQTTDSVDAYDLSTFWDISTAVYVQSFDVSPEENTPTGLSFRPDGRRMYVVGTGSDAVNEYTL